jgi:molybdopterin/thiamine biosynthesis adenylyltransferase
MVVLDLACRDERISAITLIEPDVYKPHNVPRHYFGPDAIGEFKAERAADWVRARRPNLNVRVLVQDLTEPAAQREIAAATAAADLGVCAVDNEPAKYHWDGLMRRHGKPWTLGEVLSGGIGGFIHVFTPGGPCYGCVASHLQRVTTEKPKAPDYSNPGGAVEETTIPAGAAAIHAIAGLHAVLTLRLLDGPVTEDDPGFTSLLLTLRKVPEVFDEPLRPYRFRVPRLDTCLICQPQAAPTAAEDLDAAVDQALARLGNA